MKIKTFHGYAGPLMTVYTLFGWNYKGTRYSVAFHKFYRGDEDPDCHDHPFHFWSFVLWGGYNEQLEDGRVITRKFFALDFRPDVHRHRIDSLLKRVTWTLCIKEHTGREWGFWKRGQFIPWEEYVRNKGMKPIDSAY